jgi:hypothetical protein
MTSLPNPEEMTMRGRWLLRGLKIASIVVVAIAAVGAAVMLLWNALLPSLFGWSAITFWQAVGLLVLSRILIGGLRGGWGHGGYWRARMAARWERMSEEERAQFRAGLRHRCGRGGNDPAERSA